MACESRTALRASRSMPEAEYRYTAIEPQRITRYTIEAPVPYGGGGYE
jgi:hypothetical protein